MVETRPNIVFATLLVSYFTNNSSHQYTKTIKTIFKYLESLKSQGITYSKKEKLRIEGYLDLDWASDNKVRRSTSKFIFMLNNRSIS